jgi:hypothetical protein
VSSFENVGSSFQTSSLEALLNNGGSPPSTFLNSYLKVAGVIAANEIERGGERSKAVCSALKLFNIPYLS